MKFLFPWQLEVACWDNDGSGDAGDAGAGDAGAAGAGDGAAGDAGAGDSGAGDAGGKTFTQAELDKIVTNRVKNLKAQLQTTEGNYQTLLEQKGLSESQREAIEADLENVRAQMRTKEQQLAHDRKKDQEKHKNDIDGVTSERDRYKSMFEDSTIQRAIVDAAAGNDAYDTNQFVGLLRDKAKLVDELDATGEKTGQLVPRIEWEVKNPETNAVERVLKAPSEVVELMKEDTGRFGNLFKSNVAKGLGGNATPAQRGGKVDVSKMSTAEYMAFRATPEGAQALGLRR